MFDLNEFVDHLDQPELDLDLTEDHSEVVLLSDDELIGEE